MAVAIHALSYTPKGPWLAAGQNERISLVRPTNPGGNVLRFAATADQGAGVSPDGSSVLIAAPNGLALSIAKGPPGQC